jgi:hypothetical protein
VSVYRVLVMVGIVTVPCECISCAGDGGDSNGTL